MTYAIVALLAIVATLQGFATEITAGNIRHLQNGRKPNAGAAIFPGLYLVPLVALGFAWLLNQWRPYLGFWTVVALFCIHLPFWWRYLRRLNREFAQLKDEANEAG